MALVDLLDISVQFGLGPAGVAGSLWDSAKWDEGTWSTSDIQWTEMTALCHGFSFKGGKQAYLKRYRTGAATLDMDNTQGWFVPQGGQEPPGFLRLTPGRYVRILARRHKEPEPAIDVPIPDGYSWFDQQGNPWQAHGTGMTAHRPAEASLPWQPLWFGRIDTIDNTHRQGDLRRASAVPGRLQLHGCERHWRTACAGRRRAVRRTHQPYS